MAWHGRVFEISQKIVQFFSLQGKELNLQRNLLDLGILSTLWFGSLEIRDTSVWRVQKGKELNDFLRNL